MMGIIIAEVVKNDWNVHGKFEVEVARVVGHSSKFSTHMTMISSFILRCESFLTDVALCSCFIHSFFIIEESHGLTMVSLSFKSSFFLMRASKNCFTAFFRNTG